eukprot:1639478-Heterocapsa_arctica.AAC.1
MDAGGAAGSDCALCWCSVEPLPSRSSLGAQGPEIPPLRVFGLLRGAAPAPLPRPSTMLRLLSSSLAVPV